MNVLINRTRSLPVADRWCVHSYYTLCPYAPDDSGRLLLAGVDLETNQGEVIMMSAQGEVLDTFGEHTVNTGFFHTGFWQTWSPDASYVYYQSGTLAEPQITRRELATKSEITVPGDMEGAPPFGEPIVSGLMGMLYAAGYGDGKYTPETAPMPFQQREDHGLFGFSFSPPSQRLLLSVAEVLDRHPDRDRLLREDRLIKSRLGTKDGLTLMTYCVRWSPSGDRLLFTSAITALYRNEKNRAWLMCSPRRDLQEIHLALISALVGVVSTGDGTPMENISLATGLIHRLPARFAWLRCVMMEAITARSAPIVAEGIPVYRRPTTICW